MSDTKYVVACQIIGNCWCKKGIIVLTYKYTNDGNWCCHENSSYLDNDSILSDFTGDNYAHKVFDNKQEAETYANGIRYGMMLACRTIEQLSIV